MLTLILRFSFPVLVLASCGSTPSETFGNSDSASVAHIDSAPATVDSANDALAKTVKTTDTTALLSVTNWTIDDFIPNKNDRSSQSLRNTIAYNKEEWKDVKSPFVATYTGCDVGDYFHLNFEDASVKTYDFGFGDNNLGEYVLCNEPQFETNHKYLNKTFRIYWNWKITKFPCCDGEYDLVEAYVPSITKLEMIESGADKK